MQLSPLEQRLRTKLLKMPGTYVRLTFYNHPAAGGGHWLLQGIKRYDPLSGSISVSFENILVRDAECRP